MNATRLREELAAAEEIRERMKKANAIVHADKLPRESRVLRLCRECGMTIEEAERLMTADRAGRTGYTDFALMRNAEAIRKRRAALAKLE